MESQRQSERMLSEGVPSEEPAWTEEGGGLLKPLVPLCPFGHSEALGSHSTHMHTHGDTCVHRYIATHTSTWLRACTRVHTWKNTCTSKRTDVQARVYTFADTHTATPVWMRALARLCPHYDAVHKQRPLRSHTHITTPACKHMYLRQTHGYTFAAHCCVCAHLYGPHVHAHTDTIPQARTQDAQ